MTQVLEFLQSLPTELLSLLLLLFCFASIYILFRFCGPDGLYVYIAVAVVAANVQVLKAVKFSLFSEPVALGTILFGTTYLCTDIISETYGAKAARRGVLLGFASGVLMTVLMVLTIGYTPLSSTDVGSEFGWAVENHKHISAIFSPAPALMLAGMLAYLTSQLHDVWVFDRLRNWTKGKHLWLRNTMSTCLSGLLDNTIFSVLAWYVFAEEPLEWRVLIFTYILGTYVIRVAVSLLDTPVIYLLRRFAPMEAGDGSEQATK